MTCLLEWLKEDRSDAVVVASGPCKTPTQLMGLLYGVLDGPDTIDQFQLLVLRTTVNIMTYLRLF